MISRSIKMTKVLERASLILEWETEVNDTRKHHYIIERRCKSEAEMHTLFARMASHFQRMSAELTEDRQWPGIGEIGARAI